MSQIYKDPNSSPAPDIEKLQGDDGVPVGPDAAFILYLTGRGDVWTSVPVPAVPNTVSVGMLWSREAGNAVPLLNRHGYINTNVLTTVFTLPAVAVVGDTIEIIGEGAGGWQIAQNAGQNIQLGNISTTPGVAGTISSANRYDCIRIVCRVANTTWSVTSVIGTPKVA